MDAQVEHFYRHGYLAECNDMMAQMYGLRRAEDLAGTNLAQLVPPLRPAKRRLPESLRSGRIQTD